MNRCHGWTLIELSAVCAIISIVSAFAFPSMSYLLEKSQLSSDLNSLISLAATTRQHAIQNHHTVVVCPTRDLKQCHKGNWASQLMLFSDLNNDRKRNAEEAILYSPTLQTSNQIIWKASGQASYLRFNQYGHGITFGSFYLCHPQDPLKVMRLAVNRIGRTIIHTDQNNDGRSDSIKPNNRICG